MLFPRVRTVPRLRIAPHISDPRHSPLPKLAATFSTTASFRYAAHREPNYYELLEVPVTASAAEIKKQFYSLSLRHHPDRNRDDPTASERFARISSAYNVLGNHTKRATYDRDHGILAQHMSSTHSTATPGQHPMGSYSSYSANLHNTGASYAGSRPASGLSKRRGPFRGPPPSFYAHGGYGNRKPPPGAGGFGAAGPGPGAGAGAGSAAAGGSRVYEDDPTSFIDRNNVYHFNARGHYRTQSAEDERRQQRRSREMGSAMSDQHIGSSGDFAMRFIVVCGMLVVSAGVAGITRTSGDSKKMRNSTARRKEE